MPTSLQQLEPTLAAEMDQQLSTSQIFVENLFVDGMMVVEQTQVEDLQALRHMQCNLTHTL
jgi:hypothetical protein